MTASRCGSMPGCAEPGEGGIDVAGPRLGIGLRRPVAAAYVLEAARRETVDDQRRVAPRGEKPGHARRVLPRSAAAMEDRDGRDAAGRLGGLEELRGELDRAAACSTGTRTFCCAPAGARHAGTAQNTSRRSQRAIMCLLNPCQFGRDPFDLEQADHDIIRTRK